MSKSTIAKIFPLRAFAENSIELIEATLALREPAKANAEGKVTAPKRDATIDALVAGIRLLEQLYYRGDGTKNAFVSLTKETKDYGNTSVSMGLASVRNPRIRCLAGFELIFGCLNCGTGDIKYQAYYVTQNGVKKVYHEYKPEGGANVQKANKLTDAERLVLQKLIAIEIQTFKKQVSDKLRTDGFSEEFIRFFNACPLSVFVTGTLRNERDDAVQEQRDFLDTSMNKVFDFSGIDFVTQPAAPATTEEPVETNNETDEPVRIVTGEAPPQLEEVKRPVFEGLEKPILEKWREPSYFMPQDDEGTLEFEALVVMHANLAEAKEIDPEAKVVIGAGIGRGTAQVPILLYDKSLHVIGFPFGMDKPDKLGSLPYTIMSEFLDLNVKNETKPIIALKSGILLKLEKDKAFLEKFLAILNR